MNDSGDWGVPLRSFLEAQVGSRESVLLTLGISQEQEAALLKVLENGNPFEGEAYEPLGNSCVNICESSLEDAGILENEPGPITIDRAGNELQRGAPASLTPGGLRRQLEAAGLIVGEKKIEGKKVTLYQSALGTLLETLPRFF